MRAFKPGRVPLCALSVLLGLAVAAGPARAATPTASHFVVGAGSQPFGITAGADGNLWFTKASADQVSVITPTGVVTDHTIPDPEPLASDQPRGITGGSDGDIWFTEFLEGRIGEKTLTGTTITHSAIPSAGTHRPHWIASGPDGNLWYTDFTLDRIGHWETTGTFLDEVGSPPITSGSGPSGITAGPDSNLWFTEFTGNRIARLVPTVPGPGVVTEFATGISSGAHPESITTGPDGNLWFTEYDGNRIGRITPTGEVTEFPIPTANARPVGIAAGQDGNLWFAENNVNQIGRITPAGSITEFSASTTPTGGAIAPIHITPGADGNLWFTAQLARVGKINTALDPPAFQNPNTITVPHPGSPTDGPADPYPSTIDVSGLQGTVSDVRVRITGLSHHYPGDLDVLLQGPQGQSVMLVSDSGSPQFDPNNPSVQSRRSYPANGITLNFSDAAPFTFTDFGPLVSGVYRPRDQVSDDAQDNLPGPAPDAPYGTTLSTLDGTNPNGTWKLFILDDNNSGVTLANNRGRIFGGWGLDVETTGPPGETTPPDTTPPDTQITQAPGKKTKKRKASFSFTSTEAGSSFECSLDDQPFAACNSPLAMKVTRARHTFRVRAIDAARNTDPSPASKSWKVKKRR